MGLKGPVLVPLDGSGLAEEALPAAADLARRAGVDVRLVHVHVPVTADPIHVEGLPVIDEQLHSQRREHERAYLEGVSRRLAPGVGASAVLLDGAVAPAITGHAEQSGASIIVMTTHGRSGFERAWLGSVADEVVRTSRVPLLLIRPEPGHAPGTFRRILVPLDGSPVAEAILDHAVRLARLDPDAELIVLHVVQPLGSMAWSPDPAVTAPYPEAEVIRLAEERARDYLASVTRRLEASGLRVRARVEVAAIVASAVLDVAREEQADLVALATHGRTGLARLALGSVADKVIRGAFLPVLLFRPAVPATP